MRVVQQECAVPLVIIVMLAIVCVNQTLLKTVEEVTLLAKRFTNFTIIS